MTETQLELALKIRHLRFQPKGSHGPDFTFHFILKTTKNKRQSKYGNNGCKETGHQATEDDNSRETRNKRE